MKLIIGLGNIGEKYCFTRHNVGFMVLDKFALEHNLTFKNESKFRSFVTRFKYNGEDIILAKPTTHMNMSGEAVFFLRDYFKIALEDIFIVYDDLSLDLGNIRFRADGTDGGHNGVKSVIRFMDSKNFARLKVGIGPYPVINIPNFVLSNFPKKDHEMLKQVLKTSVEAIEYYLENGMTAAQNKYN